MSLIPSKRVDRIFAVIPPLCLLLAAQLALRNSCSHGPAGRSSITVESEEAAHRAVATTTVLARFYQLSAVALALAILFTGGYTGWKVITGYRGHRNALAMFGKNIRHEAEARHWRYEVVSAKDEGLLLYLRKARFIEPQLAITEWNNGNLDALVASTEKARKLMPKLRDAVISESNAAQPLEYTLITR